MEPPVSGDRESMRDEKVKVLRAMRPLSARSLVRGQFDGYRKEAGVAADSRVETYAAMQLHIDSWRWNGVPFFIRAGKCLPVRATEVVVELKAPPSRVFGETTYGCQQLCPVSAGAGRRDCTRCESKGCRGGHVRRKRRTLRLQSTRRRDGCL